MIALAIVTASWVNNPIVVLKEKIVNVPSWKIISYSCLLNVYWC